MADAVIKRGLSIQNMPVYKWFKPQEVIGLDETFVAKLDQARDLAGIPFRISSGLRTLLENQQLPGAVGDSSHMEGLAVDLFCEFSWKRYKMVKALMAVGFNRIGVYKYHIHVDDSKTLPQTVLWYNEKD